MRGDSMVGAGIQDIVALVDNEFTCKTLFQRDGQVRLAAANPASPDIRFQDGQSLEIRGVVTAALTLFRS